MNSVIVNYNKQTSHNTCTKDMQQKTLTQANGFYIAI